jgi:hypothetical protein
MKLPEEVKPGGRDEGSRRRTEPAFPWLWTTVAVVVVFVGAMALVRTPEPPAPRRPVETAPRNSVGLTRLDEKSADVVTREEAVFRDPTPLFLPTPWNAGAEVGPNAPTTGPEGRFPDYAAKLVNPAAELPAWFAPTPVPTAPADGLRVGERGNPYGAVGRREVPVDPLPERLGFVEVLQTATGRRVLAVSVPLARGAPEGDWQPLEMLVGVDRAGWVEAAVMTGSGADEWDRFLCRFIEKDFRLGQRVAPGFYRVVVGP